MGSDLDIAWTDKGLVFSTAPLPSSQASAASVDGRNALQPSAHHLSAGEYPSILACVGKQGSFSIQKRVSKAVISESN
jgi:hypothetical protein